MSTFISLIRFTEKGATDIKQARDRLTAAKQRARESGGEIKAFYLTMRRPPDCFRAAHRATFGRV